MSEKRDFVIVTHKLKESSGNGCSYVPEKVFDQIYEVNFDSFDFDKMDDYLKKTICKGIEILIGNGTYVFDKCSLHYAKAMNVGKVVLIVKSKYEETNKKSWFSFA